MLDRRTAVSLAGLRLCAEYGETECEEASFCAFDADRQACTQSGCEEAWASHACPRIGDGGEIVQGACACSVLERNATDGPGGAEPFQLHSQLMRVAGDALVPVPHGAA